METSLDKYRVDDLIIDARRIRLVFLLESPYTDEIVHGHPLAGSSGVNMVRFLAGKTRYFADWDINIPIGCQILYRKESGLALMNGSNYPLDKAIYCRSDYENCGEIIDAGDLIRKNPSCIRRNNSAFAAIEADMLENLALRLGKIPRNALIIPCGNVARNMVEKCGLLDERIYSLKVPHPSRNNWSSVKFFDDIEDFIRKIDSVLIC